MSQQTIPETWTLGGAAKAKHGVKPSDPLFLGGHSDDVLPAVLKTLSQLIEEVESGKLRATDPTIRLDHSRRHQTLLLLSERQFTHEQRERLSGLEIRTEDLRAYFEAKGTIAEFLYPKVTSAAPLDRLGWGNNPDLRWEDINIRFLSDTVVSISAKGHTTTHKTYIELGFKDGRCREERQVEAWIILREYYARGRVLEKYNKKLKDRIKDINVRFQKFFGIQENPFYKYANRRWEPKFTVEYQSPSAGQDAPPEFVSFDDNIHSPDSDDYTFDEENDPAGRFLKDQES